MTTRARMPFDLNSFWHVHYLLHSHLGYLGKNQVPLLYTKACNLGPSTLAPLADASANHSVPRTHHRTTAKLRGLRDRLVLALLVDLALLTIWRIWVVGVVAHLAVTLGINHSSLRLRVLTLRMAFGGLVPD